MSDTKKVCPLTLVTANPSECLREECGCFNEGDYCCALLSLADVLGNIAEIMYRK